LQQARALLLLGGSGGDDERCMMKKPCLKKAIFAQLLASAGAPFLLNHLTCSPNDLVDGCLMSIIFAIYFVIISYCPPCGQSET
jgi:hypothetical protein